jgi:hypothetical protein
VKYSQSKKKTNETNKTVTTITPSAIFIYNRCPNGRSFIIELVEDVHDLIREGLVEETRVQPDTLPRGRDEGDVAFRHRPAEKQLLGRHKKLLTELDELGVMIADSFAAGLGVDQHKGAC